MNEWINEWMNKMNKWMKAQKNGWMHWQTDRWKVTNEGAHTYTCTYWYFSMDIHKQEFKEAVHASKQESTFGSLK